MRLAPPLPPPSPPPLALPTKPGSLGPWLAPLGRCTFFREEGGRERRGGGGEREGLLCACVLCFVFFCVFLLFL